ncbi:PE-PPE domain-containing protein [Gordonia oryzae]|uniref:PE-PPE domain-containing protein n=1 Tax=Gordonia oryzae TaxID=2487349 RepID=A0A3N4GCJ2_9ACTN|nr:PE-PPE domain-containing protein [Gordonia oryzae]RPA58286.1 PE-PPE domain-containing protein [Gordonia oryzae]
MTAHADPVHAVTVLVVGGTGESYDGDTRTEVTGLLSGVTDALDDRFDTRWVGYPASYGPAPHLSGISYADSVAAGERALAAALHAVVGPVMMIGYSQGAVVIRRLLADLDARADIRALSRVGAVGFVADPHQPPGVVAGCDGWGVAGPGPAIPERIPVWWVGAPEDMICNASRDSFVRDIADLTETLALATPRRWLSQTWKMVRSNSFQNAGATSLRPAQWLRDVERLGLAWREVRGYLPGVISWRGMVIRNRVGGRHTAYHEEPYRRNSVTDPLTTGCEALAQWMQVQATFTLGPADWVA